MECVVDDALKSVAIKVEGLEAGIPWHLLDGVVREVLPDLILGLIQSLPGHFIAPAHEPVAGTNHSVARFRFVPELFDEEVRAAVRAFRLKNDIGHGTNPQAG